MEKLKRVYQQQGREKKQNNNNNNNNNNDNDDDDDNNNEWTQALKKELREIPGNNNLHEIRKTAL